MTAADPGAGQQQGRECTGMMADWCDVHGACACPGRDRGAWLYAGPGDDPACPLHAPDSSHPAPSPTPPARETCPPDADTPCTVPSCGRCTPPPRDSAFTPCTDLLCPPLPSGIAHGHGAPPAPIREELSTPGRWTRAATQAIGDRYPEVLAVAQALADAYALGLRDGER